jgi:hypothetical protein
MFPLLFLVGHTSVSDAWTLLQVVRKALQTVDNDRLLSQIAAPHFLIKRFSH